MLFFVFRSLWARRSTYGLVLAEMIIGFLCLSLSISVLSQARGVAARAKMLGPTSTRVVGLLDCRLQEVEGTVAQLRSSASVSSASAVYSLEDMRDGEQWSTVMALDAPIADWLPHQVSVGRWFRDEDFQPAGTAVPAVLGHAAFPTLVIGDRLPTPYATELVIIGRLQPGQYIAAPNLGTLDGLVTTDRVVLTTVSLLHHRARAISADTVLAKLLVVPKRNQELPVARELSTSTLAACFNGNETVSEAVQAYYASRRPQLLMMLAVGAVILGVGTLGFIGLAMVTLERRTRELAVRMALGATLGQLSAQLLCETLLLSLLASVAGVAVAYLGGAQLGLRPGAGEILTVTLTGTVVGVLCALGPMYLILRRSPAEFIQNGQ